MQLSEEHLPNVDELIPLAHSHLTRWAPLCYSFPLRCASSASLPQSAAAISLPPLLLQGHANSPLSAAPFLQAVLLVNMSTPRRTSATVACNILHGQMRVRNLAGLTFAPLLEKAEHEQHAMLMI